MSSCRRVIWLASPDHKQGYAAGFPSINMHAIYSTAQRPCIYMQMEPSTPDLEEDEPEEADDDEKTPEIMLVPSDASTCESTSSPCVLQCSASLTFARHSNHDILPAEEHSCLWVQWKTCSRRCATAPR